jgi:hypothetical protein
VEASVRGEMTRAALLQADLLVSEALAAVAPGGRSAVKSCGHILFRLSMREIKKGTNR